ncbi:hypothetical protein D9Q98_005282 [Chlorella vulgaris]|uniref:Major facilitator superfamily (MFS) profile domain-containing protein n=1 Tax=Chlorella vulgaris TaxID=3077 RepID=A0A9D4YX37_CHLVU|nr:hypothetical protein D9Q98_005282 [Chlorella vulgaris]
MLLLVASFASICGFLFGYDLGLIGGALLEIRDDFGIGDWAAEAIVSAAKFGAFFGTFIGGAAMLHYGRRKAIAVDSLFFIVGPLVMAASAGVAGLVVGRVIVGLGIGISAVVVPSYLGEVAPAKVRGRVVEMYELLLCAGMVAALLCDAALQSLPGNWRWMVGAPVLPALVLSLSLCLLPESPRWLVIRGQLDEALAVIHRVYTNRHLPAGMQHSTAEVEEELLQLWSSVEKDRAAAETRRLAHAERARQRAEQRAAKAAGPAAASGGSASPRHNGGWQRLQPAEGEEGEEEDEQQQQRRQVSAASSEAAAVEAGAAGVHRRMQRAVQSAGGDQAWRERRDPMQQGALNSGSSNNGEAARGSSPLRVPLHLRRIRTSSRDFQQDQQQLQGFDAHEEVSLDTPPPPPYQAALAAGSQASSASRPPPAVPTTTAAPAAAPAAAVAMGGGTLLRLDEWGGVPLLPSGQGVSPDARQQQQDEQQADGQEVAGGGGAAAHPPMSLGGSSMRFNGGGGFLGTLRRMLGDIYLVACGPERQALQMSLWLAFFNQAFASTSIINYAPQVLERAGVESHSAAMLMSSLVGGTKLLGVLLSLFLVDTLGRRPLLLWGSLGCAASLAALALADWLALKAFLVAAMCAFIFAFSASWAGVFWVLLSELFSMSAKSPAASAATATLFLTGAIADTLFLTLHGWLGPFVFLIFAGLAATAGLYVAAVVPETKGKSLQEVQALLSLRCAPGSRRSRRSWWWWPRARGREERHGLLPTGAVLSDGGDAEGGSVGRGRLELSANP